MCDYLCTSTKYNIARVLKIDHTIHKRTARGGTLECTSKLRPPTRLRNSTLDNGI